MLAKAPRWLFGMGLLLAAFTYGFAAAYFRFFPFQTVRRAEQALNAMVESWQDRDAIGPLEKQMPRNSEPLLKQQARTLSETKNDELILVSGGMNHFQWEGAPHGLLACVVDRTGNVRHNWTYDTHLWHDELKRADGGSPGYKILGMHLETDGSLLCCMTAKSSWPYGIGLAKFAWSGELLWKKRLFSHHWFTVDDDGRIYVPAQRLTDSPRFVGTTRIRIETLGKHVLDDLVLVLDKHGEQIDQMSVLDVLADSGWIGLLTGPAEMAAELKGAELRITTNDPIHLNDVHVVTSSEAESTRIFNAGDLLLSFRNLNSIAVLDPHSRRIKWMVAGKTVRQHSPRVWDGAILAFDNWGGNREMGGTRLTRIDLQSGEVTSVFPQASTVLPEPFRSPFCGHIDLHPDGERALVTSNGQGLVWEVHLRTGAILWELIKPHFKDASRREHMHTAKYCPDRIHGLD
ncbi:MAG: arylsulfotransferase family protein [Planctomycetales bacterium]